MLHRLELPVLSQPFGLVQFVYKFFGCGAAIFGALKLFAARGADLVKKLFQRRFALTVCYFAEFEQAPRSAAGALCRRNAQV